MRHAKRRPTRHTGVNMQPELDHESSPTPSLVGLLLALDSNAPFYLRPLSEPTGDILLRALEPAPAK